jgi:O-antigen/teichoic acid export membrane protein
MTLLPGATDVVPADAPPTTTGAPSKGAALMRALAAPLLIAVIIQNAGNLILHAVLGRFLTADQYGALGTLLSLMILLTVPLSALQAAASKGAAVGPSTRAAQRRSVRTLVIAAVLVTLAVTAMAPLPTALFHLDSPTDALLLGPFVGVSIALAVVRGRLLGLDQRRGIRAVAVTFVLSTVVRLAIAFATLSTLGTTGAIVATLVGECLALAYGVLALRPTTAASTAAPGPHPWLTASDMGWSSLAIGGLFLFTTVDLFLARHYLSGAASGGYVAAATIGKTLLALPAAALAAAYPRLVGVGRGPGRLPELRRTGIVVAGLALLAALAVAAFPQLVLDLLYGDSFDSQADVVRILALIAGVSSIVSVATYALLAVGSRLSLLPWVGAGLQVAIIAVWHESGIAVALASAGALLLTLAICLVALRLDIRRNDVRKGEPRVHHA